MATPKDTGTCTDRLSGGRPGQQCNAEVIFLNDKNSTSSSKQNKVQ